MNHSKTRVFRGSPWLAIFALASCSCFGQEAVSDPWAASELLQPAELAQAIQSGKAPVLLSVAFPVLYKGKHIVHAINAGPTSKPEGIEALKTAVAKLGKDADLVIYCGCCPMVKCPNIRPAYRALKELSFTRLQILSVPDNFHENWESKRYPV